jgi:hypothetical protein
MPHAMNLSAAEYASARRDIAAGRPANATPSQEKPALQLSDAEYRAARWEITRGRLVTITQPQESAQ